MLAIGADNQGDAFYRYKMPKLVAKIEGRGNGIKTNVVNNVEIAKALERPPGYIIKYFGCELGAQTKYEESSGTSIVNGAHDASKLSELLEGFIKRYVQCYSCGNPETHVKIKKERISLKCKACGFVSDVDPRHKLNTFIINHPPENKMTKEEKKLKKAEEERMKEAQEAAEKEKKEKKKEKKDKKDKKDKKRKGDTAEKADAAEDDREDAEEAAEEEDEDGVVWLTDTSKEAAKKRAEEQLSSVTAAMVTVGNIEAEEEAARKKAEREAKKAAEAEARRKAEEEAARLKAEEELAAKAQRLTLDAIPAGKLPVAEASQLLGTLLEQGDMAEVNAALQKMTVEGGPSGKMRALYEAMFAGLEEGQRLAAAIKSHKQLLRANGKNTPGQLAQLVALEHYLVVTANDRMKEAAVVLKALYDENIIEDGLVVAWANKTDAAHVLGVPSDGARMLRRQADLQKLVTWLAEEEDEDESCDEVDSEDDE